MTGALARILLRYGSGVLIAKGVLPNSIGQDVFTDPDLVNVVSMCLGLIAMASSELWYWAAKRFGWST